MKWTNVPSTRRPAASRARAYVNNWGPYFSDIIDRDIRERVGARSAQPIRQVVHMVWESLGAELSLRPLAGATGMAAKTAAGYLEACESAYLLFSVPYFAQSQRKQAVQQEVLSD